MLTALALTFGARPLRAADAVAGLTVTNYTGYVIDADADAVLPAYNREAIRGEVVTLANNSASPTNRNYNSLVSIRLAGTNGVFVPLLVSAGVTNTVIHFTNAISTAPGGSQSVTNALVLRPAIRLTALLPYRVQATVGGPFAGSGANDTFRTYLHFTNRVPGDAAFNVIALITNTPT